jgi:hypothetical protein
VDPRRFAFFVVEKYGDGRFWPAIGGLSDSIGFVADFFRGRSRAAGGSSFLNLSDGQSRRQKTHAEPKLLDQWIPRFA